MKSVAASSRSRPTTSAPKCRRNNRGSGTARSAPEKLAGHSHQALGAAECFQRAAGRGLVDHLGYRALQSLDGRGLFQAELARELLDAARAEQAHQLARLDAGVAAVAQPRLG